MKKLSLYWISCMATVLASIAIVASCNKKFDEPPTFEEPNVNVNCSIRALKSLHTKDNFEQIMGDTIISGIVVADDKSGNFYKSIVIQDASGGITVRLDGTGLAGNYPVGRRIYIKCKGLYLGDYGGLIQLGGGVDLTDPTRPGLSPIASSLFDKYILKGSIGNAVTPRQVSLAQLTTNIQDSFQSTLIQIADCEFAAADTNKTWGDITLATSASNFTIRSCSNSGSIVLRNSSYASYSGQRVPKGNGTLVGIYNIFGSTRQIQVRDTADARFNGPRCGSGPATSINIADLRGLFSGTSVTIPNGRKISGVVISDRSTGNIVGQNVVIQQGTGLAGIVVRFTTTHTLNLGDSVEVNVSGQLLEEFSGTLQVNNVDTSVVTRLGSNRTITPRVVTLAQLNTQANFNNWESTLVEVANVSFSPAGAWSANSGNTTVTDATGTIIAFTRTSATFANQIKPTTAVTYVRGIVGEFNTTKQIQLRNTTTDLGTATSGGGGGGGTGSGINLTTSPVTIDFDGIGNGLPAGVTVKTGVSATSLGNDAVLTTALSLWSNVTGAFKNFASADGLTSTSDQAAQDASSDRALGIRQTSGVGDPGAAFVFEIANTTSRNNITMSFKLQNLDVAITRTTTWRLQYAIGDNPAAADFQDIVNVTGNLIVGNSTFTSNNITAILPTAASNQSTKVWVRLVALTATSGSGSRPTTAIDDVVFTWN
ncbi:MAG: DUF5689 domain-containing protein [Chitinophagaceae bacterium]